MTFFTPLLYQWAFSYASLQKTVYLKKSLAAIESDYKMQAESYNVVRLSHKVCKKKISSGKTLYDIEDLVNIFCNIKRARLDYNKS